MLAEALAFLEKEALFMIYSDINEFKSSVPKTNRLIHVAVSDTEIRPVDECKLGSCQDDGGCCGHFEGLTQSEAADGGFAAKCSKGRC